MDPFTKKDAIYIKSHNSEFSDIVIDIQSKWQINNICESEIYSHFDYSK